MKKEKLERANAILGNINKITKLKERFIVGTSGANVRTAFIKVPQCDEYIFPEQLGIENVEAIKQHITKCLEDRLMQLQNEFDNL